MTVSCGGVIVEPGDLIVGDGDGLVVVPRAHIATIWELVSAGPPPVPTDPEEIAAADAKRRENYQRAFEREAGQELSFADRSPGN